MRLIKLFEQYVKEEAEMAGNPAKEALADLIDDIKSDMTLDPYRDADDLMKIYNKLLPYKGKTVGPPEIPRYPSPNFQMTPNFPALNYFNKMYGYQQNNQYGMGDGVDFADRINQVGNTSLSGGEERTSDGKYTTPQVKKMIIDLVTAPKSNINEGVNVVPAGKSNLIEVLRNHLNSTEKDNEWTAIEVAQVIYNDCAHFMNKTDIFSDKTKSGYDITKSAAPFAPTDIISTDTAAPVAPVNPVGPATPVAPVNPVGPATPVAPVNPQ